MPPVGDEANIRRGPGWTTRSDAEGRFEVWVEPTRVALWVEADGYSPARLAAGAPAGNLQIELLPEAVIEGSTVWAGSRESAGNVLVVASGRSGSGRAYSDQDGHFRIDRLGPGRYSVMASTDYGVGRSTASVAIDVGEHQETTIELRPAHLLQGRVLLVDHDAPCDRGEVHILDTGARLNTRTSRIETGGSVVFRGVGRGEYRVTISCEGMLPPIEAPIVVVGDESPEPQTWRVRHGATVRGRVVDERGTPVADVLTSASPLGENARALAQVATTDESGEFVLNGLEPGEYAVTPWWGQWTAAGRSEHVEVPEGEVESPPLVLPEAGSIVGQLRDDTGEPLVDIPIHAVSLSAALFVAGHTGPEGRFHLGDLPPGSYFISAGGGTVSGTDPADTTVEVQTGRESKIDVVVEKRREVIRGRVVDDAGSPVAYAIVYVTLDGPIGLARPARALTDVEGNFEARHLAAATYRVSATRNGSALAEVLVEAGADDVELRLAAAGILAGEVRMPEGGSSSFDIWLKGPSEFHYASFDNSQNEWAFGELPPGEYQVAVESRAGTGEAIVNVEAGEMTELTIDVLEKGRVVGQILDASTRTPIAGVTVHVPTTNGVGIYQAHGSAATKAITGTDGNFEVMAPSGDVTLRLRLPAHLRARYRDVTTLEVQVESARVADIGSVLLERR